LCWLVWGGFCWFLCGFVGFVVLVGGGGGGGGVPVAFHGQS